MNNPFAAPAASTGITWEEHDTRLLVIEPRALERDIMTSNGLRDAIRGDVHVLDGPNPQSYIDVLIFPKVLISQLTSRIGERVLGRLGKGAAKPGQNPPWKIDGHSEQDLVFAIGWLDAYSKNQFASAASDINGDNVTVVAQPPAAVATSPAPAATPAAQPATATTEPTPAQKAKQLAQLGVDHATIAGQLGVDVTVIPALLASAA